MTQFTKHDAYIGNFLIEIYTNLEEYKELNDELPVSIAVDEKHYVLLKKCDFTNWLDIETMVLNNGVKIVLEPNWKGSFMSIRGKNYKRVD